MNIFYISCIEEGGLDYGNTNHVSKRTQDDVHIIQTVQNVSNVQRTYEAHGPHTTRTTKVLERKE